jgi:hypothetical protein
VFLDGGPVGDLEGVQRIRSERHKRIMARHG